MNTSLHATCLLSSFLSVTSSLFHPVQMYCDHLHSLLLTSLTPPSFLLTSFFIPTSSSNALSPPCALLFLLSWWVELGPQELHPHPCWEAEGLNFFCSSYAGIHCCCVFVMAVTMPHPEDSIPQLYVLKWHYDKSDEIQPEIWITITYLISV